MYETELRHILEKSQSLRKWTHLGNVFMLLGCFGVLFPPLAIVGVAGFVYSWNSWWKHSHSKCPKCKSFYFSWFQRSIVPVVGNAEGWQCRKCGLAIMSLPELENIRPKTHKEEWFK
jgi:hypothetical protein